MSIINLQCTNCAGEIQMDNSKEFGFCMYCGTKIILENEKVIIEVDNKKAIENYIQLAKNSWENRKLEEYLEYCNKVLEKDIENVEAWLLKARYAGSIAQNNRDLRIINLKTCWDNALKYSETNFTYVLEEIESQMEEEIKWHQKMLDSTIFGYKATRNIIIKDSLYKIINGYSKMLEKKYNYKSKVQKHIENLNSDVEQKIKDERFFIIVISTLPITVLIVLFFSSM